MNPAPSIFNYSLLDLIDVSFVLSLWLIIREDGAG